MLAILTRATAAVVSTVLGEAEVRLAEPGEGAGALATAARIPADPLLLDVATGAGVAPLGDPPGGGDERAEPEAERRGRRTSAIPEVGVSPDIALPVGPAAVWRYRVVRDWLQRWPFATPVPARVVLNGVEHCTRAEVVDLAAGTCAEPQVEIGFLDTFPVLREPGALPLGHRQADAQVDEDRNLLLTPFTAARYTGVSSRPK